MVRTMAAALRVLGTGGVAAAFGVPGAAISPFCAAVCARGPIRHVPARRAEGASRMAEGYTRTRAGNIGANIPMRMELDATTGFEALAQARTGAPAALAPLH